jgi:D-glycero-alpha-D-manno-heptose-7-phosphate kinase
MRIIVRAPNRIDLAGGTTDLYPLYLLMDGGFALNAAVDVYSRVEIVSTDSPSIRIVSEDLGVSTEADTPHGLDMDGPLSLLVRAVRAKPPTTGVEIRTRNSAPAGSGLGASSALVCAALKGLYAMRGEEIDARSLVRLAMRLETADIQVPAGSQDHIAAVYGGVSGLDFGYFGFSRVALNGDAATARRLSERMILTDTGQGRFSGMNNWEITKAFIDGVGDVRVKLRKIRNLARNMREAFLKGDLSAMAGILRSEWEVRRTLAPGVTTPRIDNIIEAAEKAGAGGSKVCGAGGGGCMVTMMEPSARAAVERAIESESGRVMPFSIDEEGLTYEIRER